MQEEKMDDFIVKLVDDDGNEIEYVLIDSLDYDDHTYVYLVPKDQMDKDEQELFIMEYVEQGDEIVFNSIDNEILLDELYNEYINMEDDDEEDDDEDEDDDDDDEDNE